MKQVDCPVVRDLLPLVIDRMASDESRQLVEEHVASCEACGKQYTDMKAEMPAEIRSEYESEQNQFVSALKAIRRKRIKRRILLMAAAAIVCLVAVFGGLQIFDRMNNQYTVPVDPALYSVHLAQLKDGRIVVSTAFQTMPNKQMSSHQERYHDGKVTAYIGYTTTPNHYLMDKGDCKGMLTILYEFTGQNQLTEIRQGTEENSVAVWELGMPLTPASEELETYIALSDQYDAWFQAQPASADGKVLSDPAESFAWSAKIKAALLAVPEWK